jgi:hypothetical protein
MKKLPRLFFVLLPGASGLAPATSAQAFGQEDGIIALTPHRTVTA